MALTVAILGATGHIGRSLLWHMATDSRFHVLAFARRPDAVRADLSALGDHRAAARPIDDFGAEPFDVVLNCVGAGDPARVREVGRDIFRLTETFDDRVLDCLDDHPERLYINMSSGAVYGTVFSDAPTDTSECVRRVNDVAPTEWYGIAKRNAEAKHRAHAPSSIVDVRVFSYFSRFLDLQGRLFVVDLVNALLADAPLRTSPEDVIRDYATPADLMRLVDCILRRWNGGATAVNDAVDLYSKSPVGKFELLEAAQARFGLSWKIDEGIEVLANTGQKQHYASNFRRASEWGYAPAFSALEGVMDGLSEILDSR